MKLKDLNTLADTTLDLQHVFNGCRAPTCLNDLTHDYPLKVLVLISQYRKLEKRLKRLKAKKP